MGRPKAQPRHALVHPRQTFKATTAFMVLVALLVAMASVVIPGQTASATGGSGGSTPQCTTEYEWVKKGTEYRWKTVYKEAKQLKGWFVELPNTWKQGDPNTWYDLPSEKQPPRSDQVAPTGTVPLSVYGGPRNVSTDYKYKTSYTEFFPSETGFSAGPPPAGKDWGNPVAQQPVVVEGPTWAATSPGKGWEKTNTPPRQVDCPPPFDWNWQYAAPTCEGLSVVYPSNIPAGSNHKDVNIRVKDLTTGTVKTFNFHNSDFDTNGKTVVYDVRQHPDWPGWTWYEFQWTQVHGTNYHWEGSVICGTPPITKDALASVEVSTQATCTAPSQVTFNTLNATWDADPATEPGTHTRTATAADGHLFADGTNKATVTYTIEPVKPGQSTDPKGECYVPPTPKVCVAFEDGPTATNLDEAGWNHNDTRTSGAYEYVDGGIRLHTTDSANPGSSQNKVTLYRPVDPTPLSQYGEPSVEFAADGSGVKPGMQVGVDVNGDGTFDGYLVGEPWSYGEHNWWVNKAGFNVPAGMGYTSFGSWADFVAANPQAMVVSVGLSLGSGVLGDWTVTSFTANCVVYTFDNEVPPPLVAEFTAPTVNDVCGTENDGVTLGESENGTFKVTSVTPLDDGRIRHRVVFTPNDGFTVPAPAEGDEYEVVDGKAVWKLYTTDEPCPPVEVPSNGQYSVQLGCYAVVEGDMVVPSPHVTLTFSNPVDVKKGEVARDAEFTYTDENGATQIVTVPANTVELRSVVFAEDSGDHILKVGLKGEEQETVTVPTDCEPNPVPFTPTNPLFTDKCGLVDDRAVLPGTLVSSTSSTDNLTGIIYRTEVSETSTGAYYAYYVQDKGTLEVEVWFAPNDYYAVPNEPGPKDTYTIEYGLAVWHHAFTNEECSVVGPPPVDVPKPKPPVTSGDPKPKDPLPPRLPQTGVDGMVMLAGGSLALILAGGAAMYFVRRRQTSEETSEL